MSNSYSNQPITGRYDRKTEQNYASSLLAPVITSNALSAKDNVINDATKSGKQVGATIIADVSDKMVLAVATDSLEDSNWMHLPVANVTDIIPA